MKNSKHMARIHYSSADFSETDIGIHQDSAYYSEKNAGIHYNLENCSEYRHWIWCHSDLLGLTTEGSDGLHEAIAVQFELVVAHTVDEQEL